MTFNAFSPNRWRTLNLQLFGAAVLLLATWGVWVLYDCRALSERNATELHDLAVKSLSQQHGDYKAAAAALARAPAAESYLKIEFVDKAGRVLAVARSQPAPPSALPVWLRLGAFELPLPGKGAPSLRLTPVGDAALARWQTQWPYVTALLGMGMLSINLAALLIWRRSGWQPELPRRWQLPNESAPPKPATPQEAGDPAALLNELPIALLTVERNGRIHYFNRLAGNWFALHKEDAPNNLLDLVAPWVREKLAGILAKNPQETAPIPLEALTARGTQGAVAVSIDCHSAGDSDELWLVTVRNNAEQQAVKQALTLRDNLLDAIETGLALTAPQHGNELQYANRAFQQLLQADRSFEDTKNSLLPLLQQLPEPAVQQWRQAVAQRCTAAIDWICTGPSGQLRSFTLGLTPLDSAPAGPAFALTLQDRTEQYHAAAHAAEERALAWSLLSALPAGLCLVDAHNRIVRSNPKFADILQTGENSLRDTPINHWLPNLPASANYGYQGEFSLRSGTSELRLRLHKLRFTELGDAKAAYLVEDVSQSYRQTSRTAYELERFHSILESIGEGIVITDQDGFIQTLNQSAQRLTGLTEQQYRGLPFGQIVRLIDERKRQALADPAIRAIRVGKTVKFRQDVLFVGDNQQELAVEVSATPIFTGDHKVSGAAIVIRDVSEQRSTSQKMHQRASCDPLTGLINRRELLTQLESLQYEVDEQAKQHILCYMDLDKFKIVNDTCGHNAGDELLRQVSHLMKNCLRTTDMLARIGGDEFCAVLRDSNAENAINVAEKLRESVQRFRFTWEGKVFEIGVSIGLFALLPGLSVEETIAAADNACYKAKEGGRNRVHVASGGEKSGDKPLLPWNQRLSEALDHDYFQLQVNTSPVHADGLPDYMDVILQLHEPGHTPLIPSAFMPNAHRLKMDSAIERWAIGKLFGLLSVPSRQLANQRIYALPVSVATLSDADFMPFLSEQSARNGVNPQCICFEIAEEDFLQNFSALRDVVSDARDAGYRICLTRFSGGASSFVYLRSLKVDFLKIDKALTGRIAEEPIDAYLVQAIQSIARYLGIATLATNPAGPELEAFLLQLGVDYRQSAQTTLIPLEQI
ncbi:diguanylate cyclase [Methylomonas rhizoryzae]|uniref:diguanylate cyclase n=1 Tax=Methylomonas rhizoryzae TaxID=2608981 RepID=UPI001231A6A4|nr:diguanylate cyclase [Methylomonas rhizoryzae]